MSMRREARQETTAVGVLVFLVRGGGYLSVDRAVGREI